MPSHYWGDEDFDWDSLYKAESELRRIMRRYGRIGVHSKEKYGTLRFSIYFCDGTLHSFTHPGYVYSQYPKWLWCFDLDYQPLRFLTPIINFWQKLVLQYAFTIVTAKYPHIRKEIIKDAPKKLLPCELAIECAKMWSDWCKHCDQMSTTDHYKCPHCGEVKRLIEVEELENKDITLEKLQNLHDNLSEELCMGEDAQTNNELFKRYVRAYDKLQELLMEYHERRN